jgi:hypothetical protein
MNKNIEDIIKDLGEYDYGFVDSYSVVHHNIKKQFFIDNYRLQDIGVTKKYRIGTCWEMVELARQELLDNNIDSLSFMFHYDDSNYIASHTICIAIDNNKYYIMENDMWKINEFEFSSIDEILKLFFNKFESMYRIKNFDNAKLKVYCYKKPLKQYSYKEFIDYCSSFGEYIFAI